MMAILAQSQQKVFLITPFRLGWPDYDGGSEVREFEINMTSPDNVSRSVYRGRDTECVVGFPHPGRPYLLQVIDILLHFSGSMV